MNNIKYRLEVVGSLIQKELSFMQDFNLDANEFISKYEEFLPEISEQGYSENWENWLSSNKSKIMSLYNDLKNANLL